MKNIINILLFLAISNETLVAEQTQSVSNEFTKGYIFSKIEDRFPGETIEFDVQDRTIIVYNFPSTLEACEEIQTYLETNLGCSVQFDKTYVPNLEIPKENELSAPLVEEGNWLPELSPFFPTMLAQPHIIGYTAGYRSYDKTFKISCLPVSIGDQFSLYQLKIRKGQLFVGIEACVWAIFEARTQSLSLINADYFIAFPLTYINDKFAMRLRIFHESSHLGDEFLLEHEKIKRLNPSMEAIDFSLSYNIMDRITVFIGYCRTIRSDDSYKIKPRGIYYGFNYYLDFLKIKICNLEATPYIATYFTNFQDNHWKLDSSIALGYQWDKHYGHKFRVCLEGHDGYSHEGQFSKKKTRYLAFRIIYGY